MKKNARLVSLIHNPTAGEGEHSKSGIIRELAMHGYSCNYSSSKKKFLKTVAPETELIAIAGGDGTIRKTIMRLLDKKLKYKRPIALLPFGTANNIASSLKIPDDNNKNISSWTNCHLKKFDVGQVTGLRDPAYFIESFGFGLFARLMKNLKNMDTSAIETPEEEFQLALKELLELTRNYAAVPFRMEINGKTIEDKAILIEVMNISSLGPHLKLSKTADPGDGLFDVVIITEKQRNKMEAYIAGKIRQQKPSFSLKPVQAKKLRIEWLGPDFHADDQVLSEDKYPSVHISLLDSLLEIVTPGSKI